MFSFVKSWPDSNSVVLFSLDGMLLVTFFWMKWLSEVHWRPTWFISTHSWKTVCLLQMQRKKMYNILEGLIFKSWNQVTSHLPALRDRAHPSHHLFNALKTPVGCYFLNIVCFRLSCSTGQLCQPFRLATAISSPESGHYKQTVLSSLTFWPHTLTVCTWIIHLFLPGGLQTQQIYTAKGSSQVLDTESMLCMKINLKL